MRNILIIAFIVLAVAAAGYGIKEAGVSDKPVDTTQVESGDTPTVTTRGVLNLSGQ